MARIGRGMRQRRTVDPRVLHLKIRVRAPKGTTREQLIDAMIDASETGVIPAGFTVHWIDWAKGTEGSADAGRIMAALASELRNFFGALTAPETRLRVERAQ